MRFDHIRVHGLGPFADVDVDLSALPAIVAITGANGAGKSTLLELLAGALFRTCPTRGPLTGLARGRDSWLEVQAKNGQPWTMRHSVDAVSGKGEAVVLDAAGEPAFASTKVREFDAWAGAHLPSEAVLYSSTFGVQGSAGFLALKPADRKSILLRVLGIEHFEQLAAQARENARTARDEYLLASARQDELVGASVTEADINREHAQTAERDGAAKVETARAALDVARATCTQVTEQLRARRERVEAFEALLDRASKLRAAIEVDETRIANNRGLVGRAEEIRTAVARSADLRERVRSLAEAARVREADAARYLAESTRAEKHIVDLGRRATELDARERAAKLAAAGRVGVDRAAAAQAGLVATVESALAAVVAAEAVEDALVSTTILGAEGRIGALRDGLKVLVAGVDDPSLIASRVLRDDDRAVEAAHAVPAARKAAKEAVLAARAELNAANARFDDCRRALAARPGVEAAERDLAAIGDARVDLLRQANLGEQDVAGAIRAHEAEMVLAASARRELRALEAELLQVEGTAKLAERLSQAEARIEELESGIARARAELAGVDAQAAGMGTDDAGDLPTLPDVDGLERALRAAEVAHRAAAGALAVAEREHEAAIARDARRAELDVDRERVAVKLADWTKLAADLGKDGIQALEIDAAGPELSALTNDLLHTCVGPRWTVTVDTQRMGSDGRLLESLEVRVLDTEAGREAPVETFSGGERVLIGEAVSLALAMLSCRRSGQRDVTLVRDESGAALDGEKGRAYVAMLRRAVTLTGARQVLLVTHSADVAELCDARLVVADGTVTVSA